MLINTVHSQKKGSYATRVRQRFTGECRFEAQVEGWCRRSASSIVRTKAQVETAKAGIVTAKGQLENAKGSVSTAALNLIHENHFALS